jgi:hypothetical protein
MATTVRPQLIVRWRRLLFLLFTGLFCCVLFDVAFYRAPMTASVVFADGKPASCIGFSVEGVVVHPFQYSGAVPAVHIAGTDRTGEWKDSVRSSYSGMYQLRVFDNYAWERQLWTGTLFYWPRFNDHIEVVLPFTETAVPAQQNC